MKGSSHSCANCHQKKVRCDKKDPCTRCALRGVACVPLPQTTPAPRKRRFPEAELLDRLRRYEAALKSYGADIDSIQAGGIKTNPDEALATAHIRSLSPWSRNANDVEETAQMLQASSDDENAIFTTYDDVFAPDGILFTSPGQSVDLASLHPAPLQIIQLWQIYLDNIHPLLRCFHAPTMQQKLLKSVDSVSTLSLPMHALLFAIYSAAVISMREGTCMDTFGESHHALGCRYIAASRYVFKKIGFLRSTDITVLQAVVISFISMTKTVDPRSLLCMSATAERKARRDGLHLNNNHNISPFEAEMRRRLWWQIAALQARAAETAAAGPSALSWDWHTALPLSVNECDIHPEMKTPPSEHALPTDSIFCLVRCEILAFLRDTWLNLQRHDPDFCGSEFGHPSIPLADKLTAISAFEQKIRAKYLHHCDPHMPLHIVTRYYSIYAFSKMKIAAYATVSQADESSHVLEQRREKLMQTCLDAIEAYTACWANDALERFQWFLASMVPFLAYVHLLFHLRSQPWGKLADRAWAVVATATDAYGRPRWIWGLNPSQNEPEDSSIQIAFANLTVKAWEVRETAFRDGGVPVPALVTKMREKLARRKSQITSADAHTGVDTGSHMALTLAEHPVEQAAAAESSLGLISDFSLVMPLEDIHANTEHPMFDYWNTLYPEDFLRGN